jgi:DNA polymerase-1
MSCLSRDPVLLKAFGENRDIHIKTATSLFGLAESQITPEQRQVGKTINYSVIYGISAYRLSQDLKIPPKTAGDFIKAYFKAYSGVDNFIKETIAEAEKNGYVETHFGRRRPVPQIQSRNNTEKRRGERTAVNTVIQGTAADVVKLAMIKVSQRLKDKELKARLLLQVHDELIFEIAEQDVDPAVPVIRQTMENIVDLGLPFKVNIEQAPNWGVIH